MAEVSKLRLFVSVPEAFGPFLQPGLTADVTVPQFPNRHFTGKFLTVARGFDVSTRTAITVFEIDNEDGALWPGSYATVRLTAPVDRNVLTIPTTSLVFQEHGAQIAMVSEDDHVHFKPIAMTRVLDNAMEIDRRDFRERPHYQQPQRRVAGRRQGGHRHARTWISD